MKLAINQNCGQIGFRPENERDLYLLGRIAAKLKGTVYEASVKEADLTLDIKDVVEELAK